jgi:predicted signal transduction protein with EAL and GGDEF domain
VCKKCSAKVTSYEETEPKTVIMVSLILAVVLCIIENSCQYFFKGTQFPALLGHDFVIFLICLGMIPVFLGEHKQVKKLLENHLKHERRTDIKAEEECL